MTRAHLLPARPVGEPVMRRFAALARLDAAAVDALGGALQKARRVQMGQELLVEGQPVAAPMILVDGWAARTRVLEDGRRQIINFTLPGDLIGLCDQDQPIASSTIVALTEVIVCPAPNAPVPPRLHEAYAMSHALEEAYLMSQITRLGRLTAHERIEDLLLELLERLELCGLAVDGRFAVPLTQEQVADAVGLTPVHVNRMLQQARQSGIVTWRSGRVVVHRPDQIRQRIGRPPIKVSASGPTPRAVPSI